MTDQAAFAHSSFSSWLYLDMLRVGTELVAGLHGEGEGGGGEAALLQEPPSVVKPLLAKPGQCSYFANVQNYALA